MNWIVSSLIMFSSSVVLYLFVRKAALSKVPSYFTNLAMFAIPLVFFVVSGMMTHQNFLLPLPQLGMVVFIAIFFSYFGNVASLRSIEKAPNPGYSLIISKSYVIMTTVVAIIFLNAELTLQKSIAIALIIGFSALILVSKKSLNKHVETRWLPLAFAAFFCWGFLSLSSKYLFNQGVNIFVFLSYIYFIVTVCIVIEIFKSKAKVKIQIPNIGILFGVGIFSAGFNFFQFQAIQLAPNVGYVNAINAASIAAVTVLAILLFRDEFSVRKLVGVIGVSVGLLLLLL